MPVILPLVLLALFHQQIQPIQAVSVALPLSMRSPSLSCWLPQINGFANATDYYPPSDSQMRKWRVIVRVDGSVYVILGPSLNLEIKKQQNSTESLDIPSANITNTVVMPTRIMLTAEVGPMQVNLTFMNPVEPGNWVKQSIPFSYLSLTARSLDNLSHDVQVFSDINGIWISGDGNRFMPVYCNWTSNSNLIYHAIRFWEPDLGSEVGNEAGTLYYATKAEGNTTYSVSEWDNPLVWFLSTGGLDNHGCETYASRGSGNTSFAIARDLGTIQTMQDPVVWAVGYTTDPAINYTVRSGSSSRSARSPYYKLLYSDDESLIVDFLSGFRNTVIRAQQLDQSILQDAASVSDLLGDLVSLALPQVFGSIQLTIGTDLNGKYNESDVMVFMKNVGGELPSRINAVETLYAAFPALMYIDPSLGTPLLEPLFRLQASPDYGVQFAAKDLGSSYSNVSISNSMHNQGVEQTGNMLIMAYATARASGDGSLISRYYPLLTSWANYLSNSALNTAYQLDADQLAGDASPTNQTNLAIKGIIAIKAMSDMSLAAGNTADADKYSNISARLYAQWKTVALGSDQHLFAVENDADSWTLGYNLFADVWLGTKVVDPSVYVGQSNFLTNVPPLQADDPSWDGNETSFDLPVENINSDLFTTVSSWNLFVAAMTPNNDLRVDLIRRVHNRALLSGNHRLGAFPLRYDSKDGSDISGMGSPAQGAMFAPMYGKIPVRDIQFNTTTITPPKRTASHVSAVTRAIIGAVGALVVAAVIVALIWHRRSLRIRNSSPSSGATMQRVSGMGATALVSARLGMTHEDSMPRMEGQQLQSGLPSPPPSGPPSDSVPIGLSAKELARMRAEALTSQPAEAVVAPPVLDSDENESQAPSSPVSVAERSATTLPIFRTMQSQFDRVLHEIQRLRAERSEAEAPPSYAQRDVSHRSGGMRS